MRLLYVGETSDTESAYIGIKEFNTKCDNPMYVGLKYGESGSLESNRLNTHNSTILGNDEGTDEGSLNWWYVNQILKGSDGTNLYDDYEVKQQYIVMIELLILMVHILLVAILIMQFIQDYIQIRDHHLNVV